MVRLGRLVSPAGINRDAVTILLLQAFEHASMIQSSQHADKESIMKFAARTISALLLALTAVTASAATFGVHTVSKHGKSHFNRVFEGEVQERVKYNNNNFGAYYVADSGLTVGAYKNSYYHPTFYAGWTFYGPSMGPVGTGLTALLATGYHRNIGYGVLRPMVTPSVSLDLLAGVRARYMIFPAKKGFFQHITVERSF